MEVLNAMQLKDGAKADNNKLGTLTQPTQFISRDQKDEQWHAWNMDWIEWQGLRQLRRKARGLLKNYKLAKGVIDKTDYVVEQDNDYREMIDVLIDEGDNYASEIKFYPIIPNVINVLCTEFAKRSTRISFKAVDEYSNNELLEQKMELVSNALMAEAQTKILSAMIEMGLDPEDQKVKEALDPARIKTLPEIETFMKKKYRNIGEIWAWHQYEADEGRFHMDELEETAFRDMLITDSEFWHFRMMEDDYEIELWNPVLTFYHKSPNVKYTSQGNFVGKVDMMTIPDVIDMYGWMMTEEQLKSLEQVYPIRAAGYLVGGFQNDGSYYDATRSHEWNTSLPSLAYRQLTSNDNFINYGGDIVQWILGESESFLDYNNESLVRVTTIYWKSQRRIGHLTKISDSGETNIDIVDESYKVTTNPVYDTSLFKEKTDRTLVYGEHIEWIWINEVRGGIKIGPNLPSYWGMNNAAGVSPMYLGIHSNKPGVLKFQFKGDHTLYGCKLPVEGSVFSDRNTHAVPMVNLMKPFQIGYNIVNNQIADILIDELGTVIMLDQNSLPQNSLGEDWGKHNYAKAYVAMKDFQILPLDTSITNTESALSFQHFQKLDMEQTNRLLGRVQLANYFKQQCFEVIGITPQRLGQQIGRQTATGVEESLNASYAQTEMYFIQHCDYLMPRVHQMRTDLAQFYSSTKPSIRLQYITSADERINFNINGVDLLLRDLNVFAETKTNNRAVLEQLKTLLTRDNTSQMSVYDLGKIVQSGSIAELNTAIKIADERLQKANQEKMQHEQGMLEKEIQAKSQERYEKMQFEAQEKAKDRQKDVAVAEIRAAGYGALKDTNQNMQNDYLDALEKIQESREYQDTVNIAKGKEDNRLSMHQDKMNLAREKLATQVAMKDKDLQIARENKNRYDKPKPVPKKKPKKKK